MYKLKKVILIIGLLVCIFALFSCTTSVVKSSDQFSDLGIIEGKVDTYFDVDTAYGDEKLYIHFKDYLDSVYFRQYHMSISYEKVSNKKKGGWKVNFNISMYDKLLITLDAALPTKGKLIIDDYTITYDNVMYVSEKNIFDYDETVGNNIFVSYSKLNDYDVIKKLSTATKVVFVILGDTKKEILFSPKIIQEAKILTEYYNLLEKTTPSFN